MLNRLNQFGPRFAFLGILALSVPCLAQDADSVLKAAITARRAQNPALAVQKLLAFSKKPNFSKLSVKIQAQVLWVLARSQHDTKDTCSAAITYIKAKNTGALGGSAVKRWSSLRDQAIAASKGTLKVDCVGKVEAVVGTHKIVKACPAQFKLPGGPAQISNTLPSKVMVVQHTAIKICKTNSAQIKVGTLDTTAIAPLHARVDGITLNSGPQLLPVGTHTIELFNGKSIVDLRPIAIKPGKTIRLAAWSASSASNTAKTNTASLSGSTQVSHAKSSNIPAIALVATGVGVALGGTWAGITALRAEREFKEGQEAWNPGASTAKINVRREDAQFWALSANVLYGVGAALAIGGGVLLWLADDETADVAIGPGGFGISGRF